MTPPPGPAEVLQGDCAPLKAEDSGKNRGPTQTGGDQQMTPPPGPAEVFQGDCAPLKAEDSGKNRGPRGRAETRG